MHDDKNILGQAGAEDPEIDKFLEQMKHLKVPAEKLKQDAWTKIEENIRAGRGKSTIQKTLSIRHFMYYAAVFLLLIVGGWYIFQKVSTVKIYVPAGQTAHVILPDSSAIYLNAVSQLSYKKFNWENNRKVSLTGEAFFKVTRGTTFSVVCDGYLIKVLGTSFDIFNRNAELRVSCFTGTVEVKVPSSPSVILKKGDAIKAVRNKIQNKVEFNPEKAAAWRNGEFYYTAEPLKLVIAELERQFDIKIQAQHISDRYYTGYFNNENLKEALENVCLPMNLHYKIKNDKTVIIW